MFEMTINKIKQKLITVSIEMKIYGHCNMHHNFQLLLMAKLQLSIWVWLRKKLSSFPLNSSTCALHPKVEPHKILFLVSKK